MKVESQHQQNAEIPAYAWEYALESTLRDDTVREIKELLGNIARDVSIKPHIIDARSKTIDSFFEKSKKRNEDDSEKYPNPYKNIQDSVAARIILYTISDRDILTEQINNKTHALELKNPGDEKNNGYDSIHIIIDSILTDDNPGNDPPNHYPALIRYFKKYGGLEIQLRTVAAHAWAEYEHDIRYKSQAFIDLPESEKGKINQLLIEAGGLRKYMDKTFEQIQNILQSSKTQEAPNAIDSNDDLEIQDSDSLEIEIGSIKEFAESRYSNTLESNDKDFEYIVNQLKLLNINTINSLEFYLSDVDSNLVASYMEYYDTAPASRRLDDDILAALEEQYIQVEPTNDRQQILDLRLRKVRGKFAIYQYQIYDNQKSTPRTAARLIREIVRQLSPYVKISQLEIEDAIALDPGSFSKGANEVPVKTEQGPIYVRRNLSRSWSEGIMRTLISTADENGINLNIFRYGDKIIKK